MMLLIGCDYHPSVQQIAMLDTETGDYSEHRLKHSDGEAEKVYGDPEVTYATDQGGPEATGDAPGFESCAPPSRKQIDKTPSFY